MCKNLFKNKQTTTTLCLCGRSIGCKKFDHSRTMMGGGGRGRGSKLPTSRTFKPCSHPFLLAPASLPLFQMQNITLLLTYKALNGMASKYIAELLHIYKPSRTLRSANQNLLLIPRSNTATYGDRAFLICAPKLWHSLPATIRSAQSLSSFKSQLKTYLF